MTQIPTGGLEGWSGGGFTVTAGYWAWAGVGEFLASSREVVFLVSDHGGHNMGRIPRRWQVVLAIFVGKRASESEREREREQVQVVICLKAGGTATRGRLKALLTLARSNLSPSSLLPHVYPPDYIPTGPGSPPGNFGLFFSLPLLLF